jgi:crossover junction endodeoxyribonuclease RuvC
MRVLGLDPGTAHTGFGIVARDGERLARVASGVLHLGSGTLPERLVLLHAELDRLIRSYAPTACAVEDLFHHRSARSALSLGHARGVCLLTAAQHGLVVSEYPPAVVKKALTGNGAAGKQQVAYMVSRILREEPEASDHASDALAAAICLLETSEPLRLME